jgi:hypothetical protein
VASVLRISTPKRMKNGVLGMVHGKQGQTFGSAISQKNACDNHAATNKFTIEEPRCRRCGSSLCSSAARRLESVRNKTIR